MPWGLSAIRAQPSAFVPGAGWRLRAARSAPLGDDLNDVRDGSALAVEEDVRAGRGAFVAGRAVRAAVEGVDRRLVLVADQPVVAGVAVEQVAALAALHQVVAATAVQHVVAGVAL